MDRRSAGRLRGGPARFLEDPEVDPEGKQVDAVAEPGRVGAECLRAGEHQVRLLEQARLARRDALRRRGARGEVVDAVVDRERRAQRPDDIPDQGRREKGPHDRAFRRRWPRPGAQRPEEEGAVDPARHRRVRKGQEQRGVDHEVLAHVPESPGPPSPVADALAQAREVADSGPAHSRVLDEENPVSPRGEGHRDFLVPLPEHLPVDGRETDDVGTPSHRVRQAHACAGPRRPRSSPAGDGIPPREASVGGAASDVGASGARPSGCSGRAP